MCRWFAYISPTEPCLLSDVLIVPKNSLVKQVHQHYLPGLVPHDEVKDPTHDQLVTARNSLFNFDGWGVAFYTSTQSDFENGDTGKSSDGKIKEGLRPALLKSVTPPINDLNFTSIASNTESRVVLAHIRASSTSPIANVNSQPFTAGRHSLMHNGDITDFPAIRRAMCSKMSDAAHAAILGSTDSEHIFGLYLTYLTNNGDAATFEQEYDMKSMAAALHDAVATVLNLQIALLGGSADKRAPSSLNLCVTDGVKLIAYRFRNHKSQAPPSLYWSDTAGTTLNRKYPGHPDGASVVVNDASKIPREKHGRHLIVASEPSTYVEKEWHLIGRNQVLLVDGSGAVTISDIPYDSAWDAEDPTVKEKHL